MKGASFLEVCHNGRIGAEGPDEGPSAEGLGSSGLCEDPLLVCGGLKTWLGFCKLAGDGGLGGVGVEGGGKGKLSSGEASCRTAFLSSGHVDDDCLGGLVDRRTFEQPMPLCMYFCSQEGFSGKTSIQVRM
jgi:hypothetical protein